MSTFPIGSTVVIQNLVNGSQFNGKRGVVQTECISGRYKLTLLHNNKSLGIKPTNMKLVEAEVLSKSDTRILQKDWVLVLKMDVLHVVTQTGSYSSVRVYCA